ncbi:unnamed protein product [Pedinophyceae sp. YPF-701]|nr:unnamed protein product [Pedinophyceae sp. YPF-701]
MKLPAGHVPGHGVVRQHYNGWGEKLMEKMGWKKGEGLGKEGQGIKEHIRVKKKDDNIGIGADLKYNWTEKWWESAFNNVAAKIGTISSAHADADDGSGYTSDSSSKSRSGGGSDSDSDSDADAGAGAGAGAGGAAARHRDGTRSTATAEEARILKDLEKGKWGRWGGRDGKMARIRAQEEAMARAAAEKLSGGEREAGAAASDGKAKKKDKSKEKKSKKEKKGKKEKKESRDKKRAAESGGSDSDGAKRARVEGSAHGRWGGLADLADTIYGAPKDKEGAGEAARLMGVRVVANAEDTTPARDPNWWGAKRFRSAGFMGSAKDEIEDHAEKKDGGFTEGDMEAIYMGAHNRAIKGKVGLGSGAPRMAKESTLGKDFEGTKVKFDSDDESGAQPAGGKKDKAKEKEKKRRKKEAGSSGDAAVNWKKLCVRIVKGSEGGVKMKKLVARAVEEALAGGTKGAREALAAACEAEVRGSKRFQCAGKLVQLKG